MHFFKTEERTTYFSILLIKRATCHLLGNCPNFDHYCGGRQDRRGRVFFSLKFIFQTIFTQNTHQNTLKNSKKKKTNLSTQKIHKSVKKKYKIKLKNLSQA